MEISHIKHLYWRAGFGLKPNQDKQLLHKSRAEIVGSLFEESGQYDKLEVDLSEFRSIDPKKLFKDPKAVRSFFKRSNDKIRELNIAWMHRMSGEKAVLRERMTLFWANHFVCKDNNVLYVQAYNNTLRRHALGNFRDFVKAISKEPAMLIYLNNKHNIKKSPNENFARELMELFTLGSGHYSEKDIKESARAFTGYYHNFMGGFRIRLMQHDHGIKRFFGKRGYFDGDDIIDIILSKKQCARFICEKIYRYFVNQNINEAHISEMVAVFFPNYDIGQLMRFVFMSSWFYDEANIGAKIKSPVDLLLGIHRTVPLKFKDPQKIISAQRLLGQILLYPPNVAGWKGDKAWIDSNTVLLRLRLPAILLSGAFVQFKKEGEFNDAMSRMIKRKRAINQFGVDPDWSVFMKSFQQQPNEKLKEHLLSGPINKGTSKFLSGLGKNSKRDLCIQLMSLPEYQMC
ncbi:MAG: DUF1800 domain-containing protein [Bacteroidia bacterium]|nr:DUF1800 domain-containing protein [Bacteroidia bacterium]NND52536.1 DUF1800 domain-containing protein [Flavobacteriaceae bacterium]